MSSVRLTLAEMEQASILGCRRQIESLSKGRKDQHGFSGEDGWTVHIEGAGGELAVAKVLGIYPVFGLNTFHAADLARNIQVRTRSRDDYDLLVRPNDADDAIFVLVTGRIPNFEVRGWILGRDAKREDWLADHGGRPPAYFVKAKHLRDISTLEMTRSTAKILEEAPVSEPRTPAAHPF